MRILVADDDPTSLRLTAFFLNKYGHQATLVNDGKAALEKLLTEPIDLVISDWHMPEINGIELCRKLRADDFPRYIYCILLTGNQDQDSLIKGMDAGADDFISKPFNERELRVRISAGERVIALKKQLSQHNEQLQQANNDLAKVNDDLAKAYKTIQKDLELAASVQQSLLPAPVQIGPINLDWLFLPSSYLAGDMLGYFQLDEEHIAFYQLDVAGHGTASALQSFMVNKVIAHNIGRAGILKKPTRKPPFYTLVPCHQVVYELNQRFATDNSPELYFTLVYGIANLRTRQVAFTQAGHPPPLWLQKAEQKVVPVGQGGFPVGIMENMDYDCYNISMAAGDRLFIYSDGITECKDPNDEMFSSSRFQQFIEQQTATPLPQIIQELGHRLTNWHGNREFRDDVTLLALEWSDSGVEITQDA